MFAIAHPPSYISDIYYISIEPRRRTPEPDAGNPHGHKLVTVTSMRGATLFERV